jgi:hypothetical protein
MRFAGFAIVLFCTPTALYATDAPPPEYAHLVPDSTFMHDQLAANSANVNFSQNMRHADGIKIQALKDVKL